MVALLLVAVLGAGIFTWRWVTGPDQQEADARAAVLAEAPVEDLSLAGNRYQVVVRRGTGVAEVERISRLVLRWAARREDQRRPLHRPVLMAMGAARMDVVPDPVAPSTEIFSAVGSWDDPAVVSATLSPQDIDLRVLLADHDEPLVVPARRVADRIGGLVPRLRTALDSVSLRRVTDDGVRIWLAEGSFATRLPAEALARVSGLADLDPSVLVTRGDLVKVSFEAGAGADIESVWHRVQEVLRGGQGYWVVVRLGEAQWAGSPGGRPALVRPAG